MDYLIIGGSGFIGKQLTHSLIDNKKSVIVKTRDRAKTQQLFEKIGCAPTVIESYDEITKDTLPQNVICLAGAGIVDKRWTHQRKEELINSRVKPLEELALWLKKTNIKLDKLLIGSAIGYYGYGTNPDQVLNESSTPYDDFVHQICNKTEAQTDNLREHFSSVVNLRTGVVLEKNGGALAKMALPAKFCLNGKIGSGQQWVSWIHINDWIAGVNYILNKPEPAPSYNLSSPNPVRNSELSKAIGSALNRGLQLPVPSVSLKIMLGEAAILLTGSQKVIPEQLTKDGFKFQHPNIDNALASLLKP